MINQVIFESISDIPAWINEHPAVLSGSSESYSARESWDLGIGFEGAMDMAAKGGYWEEGAKAMIEAHTEMDLMKREGAVQELDYDVTGHSLDVGAYLSGDPECFEQMQEEVPAPVIKIGVQQYTPGGNNQEEFMYRGAALLSAIEDLENQGIRVELWGCVSGICRRDKSRQTGIDMRTCLKRAEESWSPSSVAFGLAHAAFGRRLGFRVVEAFKDLREYENYGHGLDFKNDRPIDSDFDVWFGYNDMVKNTYRSTKHALELVNAQIKMQLENDND